MKIKITKSCTGHNFTFTQGETREVSDYIGNDLIGAGFAKAVVEAKPETKTETKLETKPETKPETKRKTTAKKVKTDADA